MELVHLLLSFVPFLIVCLLLFTFRKSTLISSLSGLAITLLILLLPIFQMDGLRIFDAFVKGTLTSLVVAYVLFFGILLYQFMSRAGAIQSIAVSLRNFTNDPVLQLLMLTLAFSPLVESASGFGIAIIVIIPILLELGYSPQKATLLALGSLCAVPWGAMATGTVIGATIAQMNVQQIGTISAILCLPTFLYFGLLSILIAFGPSQLKQSWKLLVSISGVLGISVWMYSTYISVELAGVLGSLTTILFIIVVNAWRSKRATPIFHTFKPTTAVGVLTSFSPYIFLTILLCLSRFVPPIREWLSTTWLLSLPKYSFVLATCYSPGFFLLLTCLFTIPLLRIKREIVRDSFVGMWKQWWPVTITTILFVIMAELMKVSGMTSGIAHAAAAFLGGSYLALSPFIGGLGGFLTGSNTGANAMFISLQVETAQQLHLSPDLIASVQNASASHMTMASPSRVVLGISVAQIPAEENTIMKTIAKLSLGSLIVILMLSILMNQFIY